MNTKISIDHADTFSGKNNYTYNHALYKDGLRYYKLPIGANIDADSTKSLISFKRNINNTIVDFKISDISLNKNNSSKNFWSDESHEFTQLDLSLGWIYKKFNMDIVLMNRSEKIENYDTNSIIFKIEYKL